MACIIQRNVVESECTAIGSGDDIGCQRTVPQAQSDILTRLFHKLMQGAELGIVAGLYLDGQQVRLVAYHEIYFCLRVAGIAHPEHSFLAKHSCSAEKFLGYDMLCNITVPEFVAVGGEEQFLLHSGYVIDQSGVEPQQFWTLLKVGQDGE